MTTRTAFHVRESGTLAIVQHADESLDYGLDFTELLTGGDTITSSTWTAEGGTVAVTAPAVTGPIASAFIIGTGGQVVHVAQTAAGRVVRTAFCVVAPAEAACG